ncbi:MAG: hypothetical protein HZB91_08080 [Elusimicrobia bacterium]|nr:hypothetical protein [Elusimicrobiota bacterium]
MAAILQILATYLLGAAYVAGGALILAATMLLMPESRRNAKDLAKGSAAAIGTGVVWFLLASLLAVVTPRFLGLGQAPPQAGLVSPCLFGFVWLFVTFGGYRAMAAAYRRVSGGLTTGWGARLAAGLVAIAFSAAWTAALLAPESLWAVRSGNPAASVEAVVPTR